MEESNLNLIKKINTHVFKVLIIAFSFFLVTALTACDSQEETQELEINLQYVESLTINLYNKGFSETHLEELIGETLIIKMNDNFIDSDSILDSERQYSLPITSEFINEVKLVTTYDGDIYIIQKSF